MRFFLYRKLIGVLIFIGKLANCSTVVVITRMDLELPKTGIRSGFTGVKVGADCQSLTLDMLRFAVQVLKRDMAKFP